MGHPSEYRYHVLLCPPLRVGDIKRWYASDEICRLSRTSWIFMAPTATGSKARWAPQARRVWVGAGPQRAAYRGGGMSWRPRAYSLFYIVTGMKFDIYCWWIPVLHSNSSTAVKCGFISALLLHHRGIPAESAGSPSSPSRCRSPYTGPPTLPRMIAVRTSRQRRRPELQRQQNGTWGIHKLQQQATLPLQLP